MARQKGLVPLIGTLGGINFYFRKGKPVARIAGGGFNPEAIKKSLKMQRVRENSSEFGRVSKAKKLVRVGLHPFLKDYADVTLHGRMMRLFQEIKVLDTVLERGHRRFENGLDTDAGRLLLMGFDFTAQKASEMLPGDGAFDAVAQHYMIANIQIEKLRLLQRATGMQVCFGILEVDFEGGTQAFFSSTPLFIARDFSGDDVTLIPETLPSGNGVRIAVLQVRYYQEVNGERFLLKDLGMQGLEVVRVY